VKLQEKAMASKKREILTEQQFVNRIRKLDQSNIEHVFEIAEVCAGVQEFKHKLGTLKEAGMSPSNFTKYLKIANDPRLPDSAIRDRLPRGGFSVLYELTLFDDDQWAAAFSEPYGPLRVSHKTTRREIQEFREGISMLKANRNMRPRLPNQYFAGLITPADASEDQLANFRGALIALCEDHGFEISYHDDAKAVVKPPASPSLAPERGMSA
jgi:hypothetical protein